MALRIAVAAFLALRAVLVYGDAGRLATEPAALPRLRRAPQPTRSPAPAPSTV